MAHPSLLASQMLQLSSFEWLLPFTIHPCKEEMHLFLIVCSTTLLLLFGPHFCSWCILRVIVCLSSSSTSLTGYISNGTSIPLGDLLQNLTFYTSLHQLTMHNLLLMFVVFLRTLFKSLLLLWKGLFFVWEASQSKILTYDNLRTNGKVIAKVFHVQSQFKNHTTSSSTTPLYQVFIWWCLAWCDINQWLRKVFLGRKVRCRALESSKNPTYYLLDFMDGEEYGDFW